MSTEQGSFEDNLMPKLIASHKDAIDHGKTNDDFDLERIRRPLQDGGFGITAWDGTELQMKVSELVKKRTDCRGRIWIPINSQRRTME
jgi:hypothetical protein